MTIAEQMGLQLQNTAYSVNIKERLDFSCALFDADGNLIANAPHMPVHLGSMSEIDQDGDRAQRRHDAAGRRLRAERSVPRRHAPARRDRGHAGVPRRRRDDKPPFYVGSRGHHADIGGTTPGSMPPFSTPHRGGGRADRQRQAGRAAAASARPRCARCCRAARYPARNPEQNLADLQAQVAANEKGVQELRAMVAQFGLDVVQAYMRHVQDNAEESVRRVITRAEGRRVHAAARQRRADPGRDPRRRARRAAPRSTSPAPRAQLPNNFNAPTAVLHGRGALRLPHAGRRRDPAERRLPEAAEGDHPRGLDAQPAPAGRRWWPATSRPRPASPTRSTARSA